jgi:dimethylaniline monooxygenase (N-oxide forming)
MVCLTYLTPSSVHGEFNFSPLPMPPPTRQEKTGNRLAGEDMSAYMDKFAETFLSDRIRYETEVTDIRRGKDGSSWEVEVQNLKTNTKEVLSYARIVLCTGVGTLCFHVLLRK